MRGGIGPYEGRDVAVEAASGGASRSSRSHTFVRVACFALSVSALTGSPSCRHEGHDPVVNVLYVTTLSPPAQLPPCAEDDLHLRARPPDPDAESTVRHALPPLSVLSSTTHRP